MKKPPSRMGKLSPTGKVAWADYQWNPVTGCETGCPYCYARRIAKQHGDDFTPKFHPERLEAPLLVKKPARIFVCAMGELFGPWVPLDWVSAIYGVMLEAIQHTFIVLTKWPERIHDAVCYPSDLCLGPEDLRNIWHLTSVENQATWDKRVPELLKLREHGWPVLGVSVEPMLGPIEPHGIEELDWVIIGGQSPASGFQPDPYWVESIVWGAMQAGVAVFEKNNLGPIMGHPLIQEWPKEVPE